MERPYNVLLVKMWFINLKSAVNFKAFTDQSFSLFDGQKYLGFQLFMLKKLAF